MMTSEDVKNRYFSEIGRIEIMYEKLNDLNTKCEDNMKRLNSMMLELKGIIAMVRPMAKKNDWYGEEITTQATNSYPDRSTSLISTSYPKG